jgi:hypothetical protein
LTKAKHKQMICKKQRINNLLVASPLAQFI